jgi:TetR/AcrR family transcriptional regulator, mexJK operon transcriptional repressor
MGAGTRETSARTAFGSQRAGRPSLEDARELRNHILDVATELLLEDGYGSTSIEAIARKARVSKRTLYSRFADKPALMSAVVVRLIDRLRPPSTVRLIDGDGLEDKLVHVGSLILNAALTPRMLALQRLIIAESGRFPELAGSVAKAGGRQEALNLIADLLIRDGPRPETSREHALFCAQQMLQMIVSVPQLQALGLNTSTARIDPHQWAKNTIRLFLAGYLGRREQPR